MKALGQIKQVCDSRTFMANGSPVVVYPIIFTTGDDTLIGDMFASAETLKRRGVQPGAIGNMTIHFNVREARRANGDSYPAQVVRFQDFRLANAGIFADNAPAASGKDVATKAPSTKEPKNDPTPSEEFDDKDKSLI